MPESSRKPIAVLALAELLAMSVWFSASAVVPALTREWALSPSGQAWLTMAVQLGFVCGALGSALLNLADLIPSSRFFAISSLLAGFLTALIPVFNIPAAAILLRFLTGLVLAGVYPVGMKIMTTWTRENRGWGIGLLVGALTLGSAMPHLANFLGGFKDWRLVLYSSAGLAALGGFLALLFIREGPFGSPAPKFDWGCALRIWQDKGITLANLGYFGHMWELYAMWTWVPVFLAASFAQSGVSGRWSGLAAFAVIGAGSIGSLVAGKMADRRGRTAVAIFSLAVSGLCCLLIGFFFSGKPLWVFLICLVWGFAVVADSAQFSAGISELCPPDRTGTALTLQTSLGFLLTMGPIRLIPSLANRLGWRWTFVFLAAGPLIGIWALSKLRRLPSATKMACGLK